MFPTFTLRAVVVTTWSLLVVCFGFALPAGAVTKTSVNAGNWNGGSTWDLGEPVAGDAILINHGVSVTANAAFGDPSNQSVWGHGVSINIGAGVTLTHDPAAQGSVFLIPNTSTDVRLQGSGTFVNRGTLQHSGAQFYINAVNAQLDNYGDLIFKQNGAFINLRENGTRLTNRANGDIIVDMTDPAHRARIMGELADKDGQFIQEGNPITFTQGILVLAPPNGFGQDVNDALLASLIGGGPSPINSNSMLHLSGGLNDVQLTGDSRLDRVRFGDGQDPVRVRAGGLVLNVSGDGIRTANSGSVTIDTGPSGDGRVLENRGKLVLVNTAGDVRIGGGGAVTNTGEIEHRGVQLYILPSVSAALNNSGLYEFTESGALVNLHSNGGSFNNLADGVVRASLPTAGSVAAFYSGGGGTVSISNLGTMETTGGVLRMTGGANITVPQVTSTALTGGTWKVLADAVDATLDLQVSSTTVGSPSNYDGSITSIDAGATLVMSKQGAGNALFPQLGLLGDVDGTLLVHGLHNHSVAGTLNVSGTLGGDGGIVTQGPGAVVFTGGALDPKALNGDPGTLFIMGGLTLSDTTTLHFALGTPDTLLDGVSDRIDITGDLTLDGVLQLTALPGYAPGEYRLFNYTGSLIDGGLTLSDPYARLDLSTAGQVNLIVFPVPEPSSAMLLIGGAIALANRRRRRS